MGDIHDKIGLVADVLFSGPRRIKKAKQSEDLKRKDLYTFDHKIKVREAELSFEIYWEKEEGTDKRKFTNDGQRKDQLVIRSDTDPTLTKLKDQRQQTAHALRVLELETEEEIYTFKGMYGAALLISSTGRR